MTRINPFTLISRTLGVSAEKLAWDSLKPEIVNRREPQLGSDGILRRPPRPKNQDKVKAFYDSQIHISNTGCWEWMGALNVKRYGRICVAGQQFWVHRFAYMLHYSDISGNLCVCHKCDNPPCVNPEHLFLGTLADNCHDRWAKGRDVHRLGEMGANAKLTQIEVNEMRRRYADEQPITYFTLAKDYGVHHSTIARIVRREYFV